LLGFKLFTAIGAFEMRDERHGGKGWLGGGREQGKW